MSFDFPSGVFTVLVTPFDSAGNIDYQSLRNWFDYQLKSDVAGLVLMGTTSESPTLSREEQFEILVKVCDWNKKESNPKYIILGCGGNDTREMIEFSKKCVSFCDAFMVTVPSYNKPTQKGIYEHYKAFCVQPELSTKPVMIYNVPSRTGINMEVSTIKKVHEDFKNVISIKEASGSITQVIQLRNQVPTLKVFSGDDLLILDVMCHGGSGLISVASNVIPEIMCEIYKKCEVSDSSTNLFYSLNLPDFINGLFCETNPIPVKYLLYNIGLFKNNVMRLPMTSLSDELHERVEKTYKFTVEAYNKYMETK
jgi:4-hydroxy-tetrahydrodipicolinate synthase